MSDDWCPGAVRNPQPGGGGQNTAMPPRATWHITWDALGPGGARPAFSAVSGYLQRVEYCPTIMWDPFSGYLEQFYPASESARALVAWNEDGAVNIQVETLFTPGCVVDGVTYQTVADTPCVGLDTLLGWMDSFGIPREWPLGSPQWQGNSRDVDTWNSRAGHYGHCNVPDNSHTDPGPMPDITGAISVDGTITPAAPAPEEEMKLIIAQSKGSVDVWIGNGITRRKIGSPQELKDVQYLGSKGFLTLADGGQVQPISDLDALGRTV